MDLGTNRRRDRVRAQMESRWTNSKSSFIINLILTPSTSRPLLRLLLLHGTAMDQTTPLHDKGCIKDPPLRIRISGNYIIRTRSLSGGGDGRRGRDEIRKENFKQTILGGLSLVAEERGNKVHPPRRQLMAPPPSEKRRLLCASSCVSSPVVPWAPEGSWGHTSFPYNFGQGNR